MMVSRAIYLLFLLTECSLTITQAAHILGIFTVPAKSHFSFNYEILRSLHAAGHQVTMFSPFSPEQKIDNFTHINLRFDDVNFVGKTKIEKKTAKTVKNLETNVTSLSAQSCRGVLKLPQIQEALSSSGKVYDIILAEYLSAVPCYLALARRLDVPFIGTVRIRSARHADHAIGNPNNPTVIPRVEMDGVPAVKMNLVERIRNSWSALNRDYYWMPAMRKRMMKICQEYFAVECLHPKDVSLIFYNNHASLLPRPLVPNAIDVGGIHVTPAKPLPKDVQKFIDEAPNGVILFTLGSVVRADTMTKVHRDAFLAAFATIPQRVIWKFEEPIENAPKNVMISKWLPQRDILEHKNVIVFMSHCGISGVYEAVMTGTPVVTMPLSNDQISNAASLRDRGVGVDLNFETATKETILDALNTIVNDTSYYSRMQELSRVFKDRPMSPQETVVYWTEYVLRYNGAPYLKALGTDMPFYEYFMLDIVAIAVSVISLSTFVLSLAFRSIVRRMWLKQTGSAKKYE